MSPDPNPEDRLRAALDARAGTARTSPDALDGVFTKVSRHRRNVRIAGAAGTALSIAAVALVANAAVRPDHRDTVVTTASPTVATAPATTSPSPAPPATAFVLLNDRRLAEVEVATGEIVRTVVRVPEGGQKDLSVARDRSAVAYHDAHCHITVLDLTSGTRTGFDGYSPALSPDGDRLAYARCTDEAWHGTVTVTDVGSGESTSYAPEPNPTPTPGWLDIDRISAVSSLAWVDGDTIAVARSYESAEEALLLELGEDRWLTDGTRTGAAPDDVATRGGPVIGTEHCCYPEFQQPVKVIRLRDGSAPETVFSIPRSEISAIAVAPDGTILYTEGSVLWRWEGGDRALVRRDVLAVAA